ncbi:Zn(2)-C6 fungal-specific transcription factor [Phycomyces blakesleeanus NRRL 1555(-)]|uniref:Zn(2)-C6 fungal-specific transcription factor n=2 Tax=Phycomyces blakesleeanus TaxID=4837 RepID=A0A162Q6C6_PHYB8|nr:Zn(2)-C6 fungal-specific transcription factor [Phycomyces blakesleeanus NRRL 1555(-)]OAD80486.1 Zn(2)-C6 fungal-specific transcription factor [Phycomyces blakesleeanus NRRL 1555(-)]|eukprot:XP_018298526.1 Zn(2)-C6 fungal-specific transcription factor [Phycomyces blakesleeanus NRRL 1555(-)]
MKNDEPYETTEISARKRSRATQACIICRKKKIKCDGTKPDCLHCQQAGTKCEYTECKKRGPRKGYVQLLEERLIQLENRLSNIGDIPTATTPPEHTPSPALAPAQAPESIQTTAPTLISAPTPAPQASTRTQSPILKRKSSETPNIRLIEQHDTVNSLSSSPNSAASSPQKTSKSDISPLSSQAYGSVTNDFPPIDIIMHLVDLFFKYINSVFPLIHRATLKQSINDGTVSRPLLWSVMAIGARFSDHPMIKTDPPYWAGEKFSVKATSMINATSLEPTISNLQFWGVMSCLEYGRASGPKAWIYGCIAVRICQELGLNREESLCVPILDKNGGVDTVAMALRRRIFWSCLCIDKFSSAGTNRPQYFDKVDTDANTPTVPESLLLRDPFQCVTVDGREITNDPLIDVSRYYLKLLGIFGEVNKFMARAKNDTAAISWPPIAEFTMLDKQLRNWKDTFPKRFQFTPANLQHHKENASLNYINMWLCSHAVWCTSVLVLHRGSLAYSELAAGDVSEELYQEIQSSINTCKSCVDSAMPVFQALKDLCGINLLPYMGYSAYIFATVLMTSTFSKDPESCKKSSRGLTILYDLIECLKDYWPMCERLATTTRDLLAAHNRLYDTQYRQNYLFDQSIPDMTTYSKSSETRHTPQRPSSTTPAPETPPTTVTTPNSTNNPTRNSINSLVQSPSAGYPYNNFGSSIMTHNPQNYSLPITQPINPHVNNSTLQQPFSLLSDHSQNEGGIGVGGDIDFNSSEFLYDSALFGQIMLDASSRGANTNATSSFQFDMPPMINYPNSNNPNQNLPLYQNSQMIPGTNTQQTYSPSKALWET